MSDDPRPPSLDYEPRLPTATELPEPWPPSDAYAPHAADSGFAQNLVLVLTRVAALSGLAIWLRGS